MTQARPGGVLDSAHSEGSERYLDLMKRCLTRLLFHEEECLPCDPAGGWRGRVGGFALEVLGRRGLHLGRRPSDRHEREVGRGSRPAHAETMVGLARLDNVQRCVTDVIADDVPGDLIETGVWRGGTVIFMRAILAAYGDTSRCVYVADSFDGLPPPNPKLYPADEGLDLTDRGLAISLEQVKANFERYGLLDDRVKFLVGWFKDTLPTAPVERLSVIRLDGDLYESTTDALRSLYPKLSVGGYVIVDDYGAYDACRRAVEDYRAEHGITERIETIDWTGVYWRRVS